MNFLKRIFWFFFINIVIIFTISVILHILGIDNYIKKDKPKAPVSLVGSMVDKTWQTFGIFALSFCVFAVLFNFFMGRINTPEMYARFAIHPFRIILLLMGMAITINGYILKSRWLIWCGIIGGIGGFIWQTFGVADIFLSRLFDLASFNRYTHIPPCIMVVLFAFVGVLLPGWMLKKQSV